MDIVDIHAHVLPGVDDGPQEIRESLDLLKALLKQGIGEVITTPHWGRLSELTSPEEAKSALRKLKDKLKEKGISIKLHLGFEIYLNLETLAQLREKKRALSLAGSRFVLIEFPFDFLYPNWKLLLEEIHKMELYPIVAHPERYKPIISRMDLLQEMIKAGALAQVNAESIAGRYGREIQKFSISCIRNGLCHFLATDAHSVKYRPPLLKEALQTLRNNFPDEIIFALLEKNPRKILRDEMPDFLPTPIDGRKYW